MSLEMSMYNRWVHPTAEQDLNPYDTKEKEMACQWINSSQLPMDNLSINLENGFVTFGESPNSLMSTVLNSPPESVKSQISNEDSNSSIYCTSDMMEQEQSFNFVDPLIQPMKNSQDYLCFPGANGFHDEIEKLSNEPAYNNNSGNFDYVKNENHPMNEDVTPILGNDFMLTGNAGFKFNQQIIKKEPNNINTNEMMKLKDENMNEITMHAQPKLLAKRNQCLPKLKLSITVAPIENGIISNVDDRVPANNTTVVSTPQLLENIVAMEDDFDLVNYIDSDNDKSQTTNMIEVNSPKRIESAEETVTIPSIEQILPTPVASPKIEPTLDNDDEIASPPTFTPERRTTKRRAATRSVDFSDEYQPKRPRGRPPKTAPTTIPPAEYKRLSPSDRKYYEMRIKNNEASRRSRLNRKGKEEALFDKLDRLENENSNLKQMDLRMDVELRKWEKKLFKLVAL